MGLPKPSRLQSPSLSPIKIFLPSLRQPSSCPSSCEDGFYRAEAPLTSSVCLVSPCRPYTKPHSISYLAHLVLFRAWRLDLKCAGCRGQPFQHSVYETQSSAGNAPGGPTPLSSAPRTLPRPPSWTSTTGSLGAPREPGAEILDVKAATKGGPNPKWAARHHLPGTSAVLRAPDCLNAHVVRKPAPV